MSLTIGIDVGGTKVLGGVVDRLAEVVARRPVRRPVRVQTGRTTAGC